MYIFLANALDQCFRFAKSNILLYSEDGDHKYLIRGNGSEYGNSEYEVVRVHGNTELHLIYRIIPNYT